MNKHTHRPRASAISLRTLALFALACVFSATAARAQEVQEARTQESQQEQEQLRLDGPIVRVQEAVRERIRNERGGGRDLNVTYNNDAQRFPVSSSQVGVRGTGVLSRDTRGRREEFSYSAVFNTRDSRVERVEYRLEEGGGAARREVPRWLVGTFRGRNPSGRQRMLVTVEDDGRVSVVYGDGARARGTYADRQLRVGSASVWNLSRNDDGFRAQDERSRRSEDFVRVADDRDDNDGRVPRWAVGTFRGTTDSGESELTINRDGSATATSLVKRTMFSGRYADGVLTFDWGSFNITRDGDGIRTVQVNNRRNQTSYRRVN